MITFLFPPLILSPFPLMTPAEPTPTILLLLPTSKGLLAALSYVQETQVPSVQVSWIQACPADVPPEQTVVRVLQHCVDVVPSDPAKSQVRSMRMTRAVLSVIHSFSLLRLAGSLEYLEGCRLTEQGWMGQQE